MLSACLEPVERSAIELVLQGKVLAGDSPLTDYHVSLYRSGPSASAGAMLLGSAETGEQGRFSISYIAEQAAGHSLYLLAENPLDQPSGSQPGQIRLALALSIYSANGPPVIINERSTVATAYALAQFIVDKNIGGSSPGLNNAVATVQNLVQITTGETAPLLATAPNGAMTSSQASFNSLANLLANCSRNNNACTELFNAASTPNGQRPDNSLQAMVNIAHNPWHNTAALFVQSLLSPVYQPYLALGSEPEAWTLALRYNGGGLLGQKMDGPGNLAFDTQGNAWIANNYAFAAEPTTTVCGGNQLFKLSPTGGTPAGAPYKGGGLYGAGFGITVDPSGNIWVANFGFQGKSCPLPQDALSHSLSKFSATGTVLSPADGFVNFEKIT